MENTQIEIEVLEVAVQKASEKDHREFQDLQLVLVGGGCAEVSLT